MVYGDQAFIEPKLDERRRTKFTAGTNGDIMLTSASGGPFFAEVSGSASAEAEFTCHVTQTAGTGFCGLGRTIPLMVILLDGVRPGSQRRYGGAEHSNADLDLFGDGSPSFSSSVTLAFVTPGLFHWKLADVSSTLDFAVSLNGGQTLPDDRDAIGRNRRSRLYYGIAGNGNRSNSRDGLALAGCPLREA